MGWIGFLLGLADPVARITEKIVDARKSALNAETEQQRIAADERIKTLEARRDVLIATWSPTDAWIRVGFAAPFVIYNAWLILVDKLLMRGTTATDELSQNLFWVEMVVIGFYFLHSGMSRVRR